MYGYFYRQTANSVFYVQNVLLAIIYFSGVLTALATTMRYMQQTSLYSTAIIHTNAEFPLAFLRSRGNPTNYTELEFPHHSYLQAIYPSFNLGGHFEFLNAYSITRYNLPLLRMLPRQSLQTTTLHDSNF
jgi:hypothetical protein